MRMQEHSETVMLCFLDICLYAMVHFNSTIQDFFLNYMVKPMLQLL